MDRSGINLGDKVRDNVTKFGGTVIGIASYLTGSSQALIQPPCDQTGRFVEARWFDVDRLQVVEKKDDVHPIKVSCGNVPPKPTR